MLERITPKYIISMYTRTNKCYNGRGSTCRTSKVRSNIPHCIGQIAETSGCFKTVASEDYSFQQRGLFETFTYAYNAVPSMYFCLFVCLLL